MPRPFAIQFATIEKAASLAAIFGLAAAFVINAQELSHTACGDSESPAEPVTSQAKQAVRVITKREGNTTRFLVENFEYCEATMTFEFAAKNIKGAKFPCTMVFPARKVTEAFVLEPEDPSVPWNYSYTNHYKLGSSQALHDDTALYSLPYAPGERFKVTQAYGGGFSHKGSNKYAIDWKMPQGTPVHASRGGEVVKVRDDSAKGGPSMKYDIYNNFVLIRHQDGTLGHYCHLLKDSAVVKVGDQVSAGQMLAKSGNTGFSSGPHLHFCVFKTISGKDRESVPVKFRTDGEIGTTLLAGRNYRSAPAGSQNAIAGGNSARAVNTSAAGAGGS